MSIFITNKDDLQKIKSAYLTQTKKYKSQILVCAGAGCVSSDCGVVRDAVINKVKALSLENEVRVFETGCMGTCAVCPVMLILPERIFYTNLTQAIAQKVVKAHLIDKVILENTHSLIIHYRSIFLKLMILTFLKTKLE